MIAIVLYQATAHMQPITNPLTAFEMTVVGFSAPPALLEQYFNDPPVDGGLDEANV
jgi:hypothetical protein